MFCHGRDVMIRAGKEAPARVSAKSMVKSAKKEAREAARKAEDMPLTKVGVARELCGRSSVSRLEERVLEHGFP